MSTPYKNAPIVEVVAEFHFNPSEEWDLLLPGKIHEQVKHEFPKSRQLTTIGGVRMSTSGSAQQVVPVPQPRMQFLTSDERALMQVGTNLLAINHLRPYVDWNTSFLPLLKSGWSAYERSGGRQDIQALKLRYVNKIEIPKENGHYPYEKYLEFRPHLNPALPDPHGPFMLAVSYLFREHKDWLTVHLQVQDATSETAVLALVLEYETMKDPPLAEGAVDWFNDSHGNIRNTFELCINDRMRERFGFNV